MSFVEAVGYNLIGHTTINDDICIPLLYRDKVVRKFQHDTSKDTCTMLLNMYKQNYENL